MIKVINTPSFYNSLFEVADFCRKHATDEVEIIVPDKLSLFMEKFIFEQLNISASFNIKVSTLNRFAKRNFVIDKENQISSLGGIILVNKILNEHLNEFEVFKNKAYSFSYAENVYNTINQLKASKILPEEMKNFNSKNVQLNGKIHDLQLVYEYYDNAKAGKLDAADAFLMSTFSVSVGAENKKIIFAGFDDFTAIEYSIIEELAKHCEVSVLNYFSKSSNKYIYNSEVFSQLKNIAYINELNFVVENGEHKSSELKEFLNSNIFGTANNKFATENNIAIFSGNSVENEIELVARDIKNDVINGKKFGDFGVAIYNLEQNLDEIAEIFNKYEINYYLDIQFSINKSILYKFICSILKYQLNGYEIVNLIDIINSPFFEVDIAEKQKLIEKLLNFEYGNIKNLNLGENFGELKNSLVKFLKLFEFDSNTTVEKFVQTLKSADEVLNFDQILNNLANEKIDIKEQLMLKKSKEILFNMLSDITAFYADADMDKFLDIFLHVATLAKFNNLPLTLDAVKIVDANNNMEVFNNLYIVNCTSENAPSLKQDCGIILDSEIDELTFKNKLAPTIAHINRLSKLRLFNLASMFERGLTISYSRTPSDLVKEIYSKLELKTKKGIKPVPIICENNYEKYPALSYWDEVEYFCKNDKKNLKICEKTIKNKEFLQISNENLKIFNNFNTISASKLETYFKCPFNYFLNYILKITPREKNEISSLDVGNIIHEILYDYYKLNKQVGDVSEFCKNEIFKILDRDERLKSNANSPIIKNLIDELFRVIEGLNHIDEKSLFAPYKFEFEFKDDRALKLTNISVVGKVDRVDFDKDTNTMRIVDYKSGTADASLKELYFGNKLQLFLYALAMEQNTKSKVVGEFYLPIHNDFKRETANNYSLKGFFVNDEKIVHAMDKDLMPQQRSDVVNITMTNQNIAHKYGDKELQSNEMDRLKNYAKLVSAQAVDEIKSGYIKPTPCQITNICSYCPYAHICMRSTANINYRLAGDVDIKSFNLEAKDEGI